MTTLCFDYNQLIIKIDNNIIKMCINYKSPYLILSLGLLKKLYFCDILTDYWIVREIIPELYKAQRTFIKKLQQCVYIYNIII